MDVAAAAAPEVRVIEDDEDGYAVGCEVWPSARVLLQWLQLPASAGGLPASCDVAPSLRGATLLELGAGTGYLAMHLVAGGAAKVYATEGDDLVLQNLRFNVDRNDCRGCIPVDWDWEKTPAAPAAIPMDEIDMIIGSDLVYLGSAEVELVVALAELLRHERARAGLRALIMLHDRAAGGEQFLPNPRADSGTRSVDRFVAACAEHALHVVEVALPASLSATALGPAERRDESLRLFDISARAARPAGEADMTAAL
mmetsp:Transcript_100839/g.285839  ORF Transcript_100839/g.285839 Transcript_100839/m.285839 type:complete len:256 (-) Transcript_100839:35-802(-)